MTRDVDCALDSSNTHTKEPSPPAPQTTQPPLLRAQGIHARFGEFALENVSLEVFARDRVAIIGESGSGKSLLAKLLLWLIEPESTSKHTGVITLVSTQIHLETMKVDSAIWRTLRAKTIAYIPQSPKLALNPLHPVQKQLEEMLLLHAPHLKRQARREQVDEALRSVGLDPAIKSRLPHRLSGGEAQRVCIAMMSMLRPQILICDEPTTALDAHIQKQILELLDSFTNVAIVFISHDLALVERFAKRVYVMKNGRIVDTQTNAIFEKFRQKGSQALALHPYTMTLLHALELPRARLDPNPSTPAMSLRDFSVYHTHNTLFTKRTTAISGVDFTLHAKSSLGIIGASGSGKSSLALGILGLESSSGALRIASANTTSHSRIYTNSKRDREFVRCVQIVFQDPLLALNPRMCVFEILQEALGAALQTALEETLETALETAPKAAHAGAKSHQNPAPSPPTPSDQTPAPPNLTQEAIALLESVGLGERFLYRYTQDLSGGEAQRVCIARALASGARILLLDEPTSALDKTTQKEILTLLQHLQHKRALSYVVISHDLDVIRAMCAEVLVVDSGKVIEQGRLEAVFDTPKHDYTKRLLAAQR